MIHSFQRGGAEHLLLDLAGASVGAGFVPSFVSLMPAAPHAYARRLQDLTAVTTSLDLRTRWDARALSRAVAAVRELDPDILHTHLKHADLVGAFAAGRLGLPQVSTLHLIEEAVGGVGTAKRWLAGYARRRFADRTIAVSESQRLWYLSTFPADPRRVVTIRNGVPAPAGGRRPRDEVREALGVPADAVVATMVGIMRPRKGFEQLLAAVARIRDEPNLVVVLAGDGPLRSEIEARARAAPMTAPKTVFAGFVEDIDELLMASDLMVHPSLEDALPTALLHGLANGSPIIASAVGGIPEIVTQGVGILVRPGDVDSLATALVALAGDERRRQACAAAALERFQAEFEISVWLSRLRDLYEEVLEERGRPIRRGAPPKNGAGAGADPV